LGKKVLVIDDEQMMLDAIKTILEEMGHQVDCFSISTEGEKSALESDYDLVLTDIRMPEKNGAELTEAILKRKPNANILVITGHPNDPLTKRALDAGAKGLVKKPFEMGKILEFLKD
jgi:DNA-binding NtrC family response regulator